MGFLDLMGMNGSSMVKENYHWRREEEEGQSKLLTTV